MELIEFRRLLAETVAWCRLRGSDDDPAWSLRTPPLRPTNLRDTPDRGANFEYDWGTREQNQAVVSGLAERRAELLRAASAYPDAAPMNGTEGRLLIAVPQESDWCCLSETESEGFIDALDVPAWDTWLCWVVEPTLPDAEQVKKTQEAYRAAYGKSRLWPLRKTRPGFVDWQPPASVSYLLCWVPPQFLGLVNGGIMVNPVECFFWAADYKRRYHSTPLMRQLDAEGLLR